MPVKTALDEVLELTVLLGTDMQRSLAEDGLTEARAHLLWVIQQGGPCTQRALADALRVSARNITGLVDGLEAGGLVVRERHPNDRRAILVTFTPHGAQVAEAMAEGYADLQQLLFGAMSDRELRQFRKSLRGVVDRLRARLEESR